MKTSEYIGVFILIAIVVNQFVFITSTFVNKEEHINYITAVLPSVLVRQTNDNRLDKNLSALKVNYSLQKAAQNKADDMATKGYFSHDTPEGYKPWKFINDVGYSYVRAGENLAVNFVDSEDVTNAWMKSETHKNNILNPSYSEIGIATSKGTYKGKEAVFVVQIFATPNLLPVTPRDNLAEENDGSDLVAGFTEAQMLSPFTGVLGVQDVKEEFLLESNPDVNEIDNFLTVPQKITILVSIILFIFAFLYGLRGIYLKSNNKDEEFSIIYSNISFYIFVDDYRYMKQSILLMFIILIFTYVNSEISPIINII